MQLIVSSESVHQQSAITIAYQYDSVGNLTKVTDAVRNGTVPSGNGTTFVYDGLRRLWKEQVTLAGVVKERVYEYDANYNLVKKTDRNGRVSV